MKAAAETRNTHASSGPRSGTRAAVDGAELVIRDRRRFGEEPPWFAEDGDFEGEQLTPEMIARIARLEAAMGATLSLLRRCIVERTTPTREELASEAGFVFGTSREAAMAELDEVAQMVGVSSIR